MGIDFKQWSVAYRPRTLDDVIENESAVSKSRQIIKNRDTHAILFYGPTGCGKTTLAKILANSLTKVKSDIVEKNISDERTIGDIRNLINQSKFMAQGGCRVFILDEVHALLGQGQSAILKALEEPEHDKVVWILCTNKPHMLDAELLNRLYKIGVEKPSEEALAKLLYKIARKEEAFKFDKSKTKKLCLEIAKVSDRVPREALQLLKEVSDSQDSFKNFKDLVVKGIRKSIDKTVDRLALQVIMAIYSPEKDVDERANYLVNILFEKDIWGMTTRLVTIHQALINYIAGIQVGASFYYVKELKEHKAVPDMVKAVKVARMLVNIRTNLKSIDTSIQDYVVPELVNILYALEEAD